MALIPNRGPWTTRLLDSNSTATFVYGSAVALDPRRRVIEYSSVKSAILGIALGSSVDSLAHPGQVLVAVPTAGCTMWVPTGTTAVSALSIGQACGLAKSGNTFDQIDTTITSTVSVVGYVYGEIQDTSTVSRIEVMWAPTQHVFGSASSNTFAT